MEPVISYVVYQTCSLVSVNSDQSCINLLKPRLLFGDHFLKSQVSCCRKANTLRLLVHTGSREDNILSLRIFPLFQVLNVLIGITFFLVCSVAGEVIGLLSDYLLRELPLDIENIHKGATTLCHLKRTLGSACQGLNRLSPLYSSFAFVKVGICTAFSIFIICCVFISDLGFFPQRGVLGQELHL